jgi:hypothetical protein
MTEPRRYSLWLPLEGLARGRVEAVVAALAAEHGASVFEPHVTVLGELAGKPQELARALRRLAIVSAPFDVRLTDAAAGDSFFRALYVRAEGPGLHTLRARAAAAFGVPAEDYRPHASLLYAHLPAAAKGPVLDRLGRRFGLPFEARRLEIWDTGGPVEAWQRVARATLGGEPDEEEDGGDAA